MSAVVGHKYGIAVSNGTAALEVAVQALGIGEGDYGSSFVWSACSDGHNYGAGSKIPF